MANYPRFDYPPSSSLFSSISSIWDGGSATTVASSSMKFFLSEKVCELIRRDIANYEPERGGFLFGNFDTGEILEFLYDEDGRVGQAHYLPSRNANAKIAAIEGEKGLKMIGLIHSHPKYLSRPSPPDISATRSMFALNETMPFFLTPIVTHNGARDLHEMSLGGNSAMISWYVTMRNGTLRTIERPSVFSSLPRSPRSAAAPSSQRNEVVHLPQQPQYRPCVQELQVKIQKDLSEVFRVVFHEEIPGIDVPAFRHVVVALIEIGGKGGMVAPEAQRNVLTAKLPLLGETEATLVFSESYPFLPPVLIAKNKYGEQENFTMEWWPPQREPHSVVEQPELHKLIRGLRGVLHFDVHGSNEFQVWYGLTNNNLVSQDPRTKKAGLFPFLGNPPLSAAKPSYSSGPSPIVGFIRFAQDGSSLSFGANDSREECTRKINELLARLSHK